MHPLFLTIVQRPDLVIDHLSAYAALLKQETNEASKALVGRVLVYRSNVCGYLRCFIGHSIDAGCFAKPVSLDIGCSAWGYGAVCTRRFCMDNTKRCGKPFQQHHITAFK
jgi:hypothetical protein